MNKTNQVLYIFYIALPIPYLTMSEFVKAHALKKVFADFTAVDDISLQVDKGQVLGFLGPNGAGKTTTMRLLTGFMEPDAGEVHICGCDMLSDPIAAKRHIGYLPEGAPLYGDMTVRQFLKFISGIRKMTRADFRSRLDTVVEQLQLHSVMYQTIETLSKGFKRRVGLAQAILHDPDVLILDEPTDGLDPLQKHEVRTLIQNMAQTKAIIISTHILEEVEAVCTRIAIIAQGKMCIDSTPTAITAEYASLGNLDAIFRHLVSSTQGFKRN